jgi:hypothetical protein
MIAHTLAETPLSIVEVFDAYDGPRLFSARDAAGVLYLALWVDDMEDESIWLYLPLSASRMAELQQGQLDLRSAFLAPEMNTVFRVRESARGGMRTSETLPPTAIPHDELPTPGEYLHHGQERSPTDGRAQRK